MLRPKINKTMNFIDKFNEMKHNAIKYQLVINLN